MNRLLIIDDDLDYQDLLTILLDFEGFKIRKANNPLEAMPILQKDKIDLIIMELKLPYLEGTKFIKWLDSEANINVPVLILTALNKNEVKTLTKEVKVTNILHKPSYKNNIINKINRMLKIKKDING